MAPGRETMLRPGRWPSRLFGRDRELSVLDRALGRAQAGSPAVVVLAGESGIGKSRLLSEFLDTAGTLALAGSCVPVAGEALPFAPITQALRRLDRPPALGGTLAAGADGSPSPFAQLRWFESLLDLLTTLSADRPVTLVVEDVHWADRSTLDLLAYLTRNLDDQRVLMALTVRSDGVPRDSPLRGWLAELDQLPQVTRLALTRLDAEDTARQVSDLRSGQSPDPAVADLVYSRSAGNPLFTEQLLPWATDPSRPLPETLSDLVSARFAVLPPDSRRVTEIAAVLGPEFGLDLLVEVTGLPPAATEELLRPAIDRHLLQPGTRASYAFAHPLFGEVLEAELLPGERCRLHADVARVLAARLAADPRHAPVLAGQLADHLDAAGPADQALGAAIRAGLEAGRVFAFSAADVYLSRAVILAEQVDEPVYGSAADRTGLHALAAQHAYLAGDSLRAVRLAELAVAGCNDPLRRAELLERLGTYYFEVGRPDDSRATYRTALALSPDDQPSAARARLLAGLSRLAMGWSNWSEAESWGHQAVEAAATAAARREEGRARNSLGVALASGGRYADGVDQVRASLQIADELHEAEDLASAYIHLVHVLGLAGRYDEAVEVAREGVEAMHRVGLTRQKGAFLLANAAETLIKLGRYDEAAAALDQALAQRPRGLQLFPVLDQSARLALARGRLAEAASQLASVRVLLEGHDAAPRAWWRALYEVEAELALWEHRPADAFEAADAGLALLENTDEQRFAGPLVALAARAVAEDRSTESVDGPAPADRLTERLSGLDPDPRNGTAHPFHEGEALALTIAAELERTSGDPAADAWRRAAEAWAAVGHPFPAAYASWREAEAVVLAQQPGERPIATLRAAHQAAIRLGADGLAAEAQHLACWGRVDLDPGASETPGGPEPAGSSALGLTARELEVLSGLVAGRTNREIAETLFISVKTASVHVSNILRKLDVTSRTEAARLAHRVGIGPR